MFGTRVLVNSDGRRRGELSVFRVFQISAPRASPRRRGRRVDQRERRSHDPTPESIWPLPKGEGHVLAIALERADHRLAKSKTHRMLISNEADRLVYEPGLAGQKSEVITSPVSRLAWRGLSFAITIDLCLGACASNE